MPLIYQRRAQKVPRYYINSILMYCIMAGEILQIKIVKHHTKWEITKNNSLQRTDLVNIFGAHCYT